MTPAASTVVFRSRYYQLPVCFGSGVAFYRHIKAGPTGTAFKLGIRIEKGKVAGCAKVSALSFFIIQLAAPGAFGALFEHDVILLLIQYFFPFFIGLFDGGNVA